VIDDDGRDYVDIEECAVRMNLTVQQVMHLVRIRALHSVNYGFGLLLVEPAILSGARPHRKD
jgi:hypothetical protein